MSSLPPGPKRPRLFQTLDWVRRPIPIMRKYAQEYGECFTLRWLNTPPIAFFSDPVAIQQIFTASPEDALAGRANVILKPILGKNSVLLLDGARHKRERKLLMPPFHGERMRLYGETMREIADRSIDTWPVGQPFPIHQHTREITLDIILRTVFGVDEGALLQKLRSLLIEFLRLVGHSPLLLVRWLQINLGPLTAWQRISQLGREIDAVLHEQIAQRRAAAHLLGLSQEQLQHALGISASRVGGLMANVGTMAKAIHCGWAALSGLDAALLAARGFTGNPTVFEAPNGYVEHFFGAQFQYDELLRLGQSYRMVDPGFVMKMFPCQYGTHFGILAALALRRQIARPDSIRAVHITAPVMPYVDLPALHSGLDGKFSFQYTVAAALLDGAVSMQTFSDDACARPALAALLSRTRLTQDGTIPDVLESMWVDVAVELQDGQRLTARCDGPPGFWGRPPLAHTDHLVKIRDCLSVHLTEEHTQQCIQLVERLETLEAPQIAQLMTLIG